MITAVLRPRQVKHFNGAVTSTVEPPGTITIYANEPNCSNPEAIAAEGTSGEFEGPGIEVQVEPDSVTTFYASLTKESGTSPCSPRGVVYRQVSTPPEPPTFSSVSPESPANNVNPHLIGNAESESIVSIYTNADCSGLPVASGSAAVFATEGIPVSVPENSVTTFYAKATLAETLISTCSTSSVEYQDIAPMVEEEPGEGEGKPGEGRETSPPPAPQVRTDPSQLSNDTTPLVTGSAPFAKTVEIFENSACKGAAVSTGSTAQFVSGISVRVAENASTTFYGESVGAGGAHSPCSAPVQYREDSTPPHTMFTMAPGAVTHRRTAVFRFTDITDDPFGTSFYCKVNRGKWRPCHTPLHLRHLRFRSYVVHVKGIDGAGNAEQKGVTRRFKVARRS